MKPDECDIVERLRQSLVLGFTHPIDRLRKEAADEIERLRAALQEIVDRDYEASEIAIRALRADDEGVK